MRKSVSAIVSLGIVTAIFLAIMSMVYLQHMPSQADLDRLEADLRQEFGLYLSALAPLELELLEPESKGRRMGVSLTCTMRPDLQKRSTTVVLHLDRMAQAILDHPDWRGKIDLVTVAHAPPLKLSRTRRARDRDPES